MVGSAWSLRASRALVAAAALLPVLQACGSRSDTEVYLFGADGPISVGAKAGSAGSQSTGATGGRGSGVAGSAAVGGRAATAGSSGIGGAAVAGTSSVAGASPIAGQGGVVGMAGSVGAGGVTVARAAGAPAGNISCGDQRCDSATQSCCLAGSFECIARGEACSGPVLGCTSHSDCDGELCCLSLTGEAASASACKPRCNSMGSGRDRQLCDTDADCQPPFRFCRATVFGLNLCVFRP